MTEFSAQAFVENRSFDEIHVGASASLERTLCKADIELFAVMSGDVNLAHVDQEFAKTGKYSEVVAHGMWGGALLSKVRLIDKYVRYRELWLKTTGLEPVTAAVVHPCDEASLTAAVALLLAHHY